MNLRNVAVVLTVGLLLAGAAQADLIGYWGFEDNLTESSGYAQTVAGGSKAAGFYDGEVAAGTIAYSAGAIGKCLDLTGGDNAVQIKNSDTLSSIFAFGDHTKVDFTIAFWVKGWPGDSGDYGFVTRGFTDTGNHGMGVGVKSSSDNITFKFGDRSDPTTGDDLGDANWHHVAVVVNATTLQMLSYIDGDLAGTMAIPELGAYYYRDSGTGGDEAYILFGADQSGEDVAITSFAKLPLDEIRIYNEALSETAIEGIMAPEPATMSLLALGGLAMIRRRRRA